MSASLAGMLLSAFGWDVSSHVQRAWEVVKGFDVVDVPNPPKPVPVAGFACRRQVEGQRGAHTGERQN